MRRRTQRGNALVETALAFAIIIPVFTGTFQFGLAIHYYNGLANAVRAGARYAGLRTYDSATAMPSAGYVNAVRNMTVYGDPAGGTVPVVSGLAPEHVQIEVLALSNVPHRIRVSIREFPMNVALGTFRVSKPEAVFPYLGNYAPEQ